MRRANHRILGRTTETRKALTLVWGVWRNGQDFDPNLGAQGLTRAYGTTGGEPWPSPQVRHIFEADLRNLGAQTQSFEAGSAFVGASNEKAVRKLLLGSLDPNDVELLQLCSARDREAWAD